MKKLMAALCAAVLFASAANAECVWSWWANCPAENTTKNVRGCVLGFASEVASVRGAQVSICYNKCGKAVGVQYAFGYNRATSLKNGAQIAFWNSADAAALQFGLLCFNKQGFLPFFPFFNMCKAQFGAAD